VPDGAGEQRVSVCGIALGKWDRNQNHENSKDESTKKEGKKVGHEFEALSGRILEAAVAVHKALGPGFLESVYQKAMEVALCHRALPFQEQKEIHVFFEEVDVGMHRLDLIVGNEIVVELKAVKGLEDIHYAQVKSYLKATGLHVGLLLNFNSPTLVIKRVVL
jgi:GxxExxY protein